MRIAPYREIAAILVIGLIVGAIIVGPKVADYYADPLALVVGGLDPQWESPEGPRNEQGFLLREPQYLKSGVVEISLKSGVHLIVQGPARFRLDSQAVTRLDLGRITVKVPHEAIGFAVLTPGGRVTDLGTEFGVEVHADKATHMEVFRGTVAAENAVKQRQIVQAEQAVAIDATGQSLKSVTPQPDRFVRQEQLAALALERWKRYSEQLRQDPSLVAYYTFDNQAEASDRVLNRSVATAGESDGIIENCMWDEGRLAGKQALRFNGNDSRVKVNIPGQFTQITFAGWVQVDELNHDLLALLLSDGFERDGQLHWQIKTIDHTNLVLGISRGQRAAQGAGSNPLGTGSNPLPEKLVGRWVHLACTYDSRSEVIRFYFDGAAAGQEALATSQPLSIGSAQIGNWNRLGVTTESPERGFCGRIDELAVFSRALSEDEIRAMYQAGTK